jgi:uncharacterized membrane-anchored protein
MALRRAFRTRGTDPGDDPLDPPILEGPARPDARTKDLIPRLATGDIAVIDHTDLDRIAAEGLVAAGPVAVVNVAVSCTGRYPNDGPLIVLRAGIALLDGVGPAVMSVTDGDHLVIDGDRVLVGGEEIGHGVRQTEGLIEAIHEETRGSLAEEFGRFVDNTVEYMDDNRDLLADDFEVPQVQTRFEGRHVLLVVRGHDFREDLALMRGSGYVREMHPVLIGVDGGADALLEVGLTPDLIIGDMDSVSERALNCGAELVVHAFRDGRAPGAARLEKLGLPHYLFSASGTSEDIGMLLAYELGATLIVAVGTHTSMVDFLDKGRRGMASTFITRMKVGPILVDAKGLSRLYENRVRKRDLLLMVLAAVITLVVITIVSEPIRLIIRSYWSDFTH